MTGPVFTESPDRLADADSRYPAGLRPTPQGWHRVEHGGWINLLPSSDRRPAQGWKVHVSARSEDASRTVDTAWTYCVEHLLAFKFLRSGALLAQRNAKQADRSAGGKLLTLYPEDDLVLQRTLEELSVLLKDVRGPYVLSDLRWSEGPLYVRYGAFEAAYCFSPDGDWVPAMTRPDGRRVPDRRRPFFTVPDWAPVPSFLADHLRTTRDTTRADPFPYTVEKALHFSNGGGVYRAVDRATGRRVVLREARPHAGLDRNGEDAVERLRREHDVLQHLAHLACVPRVHTLTTHWEHHFLVREHVDGEPLHEAIGRLNPLLRPAADPARTAPPGTTGPLAVGPYTSWALEVFGRVEEAVARLHSSGIVLGDLKPANILLREDGSICVIDFETAHAVTEPAPVSLTTPGFSAPWARSGFTADTYALGCLGLALFCPLTPLLRFDPAKAAHLLAWARQRFPLPPEVTERIRTALTPPAATHTTPAAPAGLAAPWPTGDAPPDADPAASASGDLVLDSLRDSIVHSATPQRTDRLFPGDVRQFDGQGGTLAFGAAGVLHTLHTTGHHAAVPAFETWIEWLVTHVTRLRHPRPGLYDGLAGVAWILKALGRPDEARAALEALRTIDLNDCGPGLFGGLSGIALVLRHFGEADAAARIADELGRRLTGPSAAPDRKAGLMHGWSGPALLFTRLFADAAADADERHLDLARLALTRDLDRCTTSPEGHLQVRDGRVWLGGLERGSAGIALALHTYLRYAHHPALASARDRIQAGLDTELLPSPGLFTGHAGHAYTLAHLDDPSGSHAHLHRLAPHVVPCQGTTAFALDSLQHLSMDLATGTAGVLLAAHVARTARPNGSSLEPLSHLLPGP
ncbi:class III lanthionine synthetase LanKC [Streptomyces sp. NPDC005728]|uniref:class III lanthionine synthetase LanKC n=1 Tax=Streptomyces sp. NPDC005728 TaxID=3157054 RepID=UPI0033CDD4B1